MDHHKIKKRIETLIQTIRIYSRYIGMEFGKKKCTILIMRNGKRQITEELKQPNEEKNQKSQRKGNVGILEACYILTLDRAVNQEMDLRK